MARFRIQDIRTMENAPTSPGGLKNKFSELIYSSTKAMAKVDSINPETGEYRIVLQGTLDKEETRFDET
jgi:hypothetical protein